ncbi:MAG: phosphate/phosphite/phosphonate ABC transporter substrate-binding protein [Desulfobacteraceae bacterium]|nr:phosphate/phosphite/phosphonate ABC transporter substrate-binding protein [Desulfobacteraceae bacterium]
MKIKKLHIISITTIAFLILLHVNSYAAQFKIGIMQDKRGAAVKFEPLLKYLIKNGIDASFVSAKSYPAAANMFKDGKIDGMFSGSGVAGCLIIKELAIPLVRPLSKDGYSTYWAVVLAPRGSPVFTQSADYFKNKAVIFCSLASSGEFYFRSLTKNMNAGAEIMKASSHNAAIDTLSRGIADVAIVKNRVWENAKAKYSGIVQVGEDTGENPNGTMVVSKKTSPKVAEMISAILLRIKDDNSSEATTVKESLNIVGYIETSEDDFKFTIPLLKRAGVDKSFNFSF